MKSWKKSWARARKPSIMPVSPPAMADYLSHVEDLARNQLVELHVFSIVNLFDCNIDPALGHIAVQWMRGVKAGKLPICLCCDTQWKSFADVPPGGFAIITNFKRENGAICSGLLRELLRSG